MNLNLTDIVKPITDTANKVIDNIPTDNNAAKQANDFLQSTKELDLQQNARFGNQFDKKNPRSWAEAITVVFLGLQLLLISASCVLSI
jgi:hypothetical protein